MAKPEAVILDHRGVLRATGPDLRPFLQGLISNDVEKISENQGIWSAFLTPQGKFLHEFVIGELGGGFLIDCEAARREDLLKRLTRYRLRAKVELADASADFVVAVCYGADALTALDLPAEPGHCRSFEGGLAMVDPRLAALGARLFLPRDGAAAILAARFAAGSLENYDRLRIALGVPDGSRDLEVERSILLENGFDELGGVDWAKGCFIGQELTARTKHRALIKKRLLPVEIEGPAPPEGSEVSKNGRPAGVLRSVAGDRGLALLRLARLAEESDFTAGEARLLPRKPDWAEF